MGWIFCNSPVTDSDVAVWWFSDFAATRYRCIVLQISIFVVVYRFVDFYVHYMGVMSHWPKSGHFFRWSTNPRSFLSVRIYVHLRLRFGVYTQSLSLSLTHTHTHMREKLLGLRNNHSCVSFWCRPRRMRQVRDNHDNIHSAKWNKLLNSCSVLRTVRFCVFVAELTLKAVVVSRAGAVQPGRCPGANL
jgi:hypothetical protein